MKKFMWVLVFFLVLSACAPTPFTQIQRVPEEFQLMERLPPGGAVHELKTGVELPSPYFFNADNSTLSVSGQIFKIENLGKFVKVIFPTSQYMLTSYGKGIIYISSGGYRFVIRQLSAGPKAGVGWEIVIFQ